MLTISNFLGFILVSAGLLAFYLGVKFLLIPPEAYKKYKKGLSTPLNTLFGDNTIEIEGAVHGMSRNLSTGEVKMKSSYSPEHTKRLLEL